MAITIKEAKTEIGATGLDNASGIINEEFLNELQGEKGRAIYEEMSNNSAVVGGMLFAIEMLIRGVDWSVNPASDSSVDEENASFLTENMHGMKATWEDFLSEALSFLVYGWAYHEIVYAMRGDGRVVWKNIPIRGQGTLCNWEFDENGGLEAMVQNPPPTYTQRTIPIEKALLFRSQVRKNNPEGRSILRTAYRSWYFAKNIENIEGVGIERDLAGLPIATCPASWMKDDATEDQKKLLAALKKIVTKIRRNENEGLVLPYFVDEKGNLMVDVKLLSSPGKRQHDTSAVIDRWDKRILMSVLADVIMLGNANVGSFALSSNKTEMFASAIGAWLDSMTAVMNRFAVPRLFSFNSFNTSNGLPQVFHGDIETIDLDKISNFVLRFAQAGGDLTPEDFNFMRKQAGMPLNVEAKL